MEMSNKPRVYINPNAPAYLKNILEKVAPDADKMSAKEAQEKIDSTLQETDDTTEGLNN
jgi:hypothetical protein